MMGLMSSAQKKMYAHSIIDDTHAAQNMSFQVLIGRNTFQDGTNRMVYRFPSPVKLEDYEVGLVNCSIPNSFANVSKNIGNADNVLTVRYPVFTQANVYTMQSFTVSFSDGYYDYSDMAFVLQSECIKRGLYLIGEDGKYTYFINFAVNMVTYSTQFFSFYIPIASEISGYTLPPGAPQFINPAIGTGIHVSPEIVVENKTFGKVIGFRQGTALQSRTTSDSFASVEGNLAASVNSPLAPQLNQIYAVLLRCSVVSHPNSLPNDMLALFPLTAQYGAINSYSSQSVIYTQCTSSLVSEIAISFYDEDVAPLQIVDSDITMTLHFREKPKLQQS